MTTPLIDKAPSTPGRLSLLYGQCLDQCFFCSDGSLVGGFTTFVTTYASRRSQYRRDFLSKQFAKRETLYSEFINEAACLQIDSFDRQMDNASGLVNIYALENRIRLNALEEVIQAAVHTIENIIESYKRPNMTAEEIRHGAYLDIEDPLKQFGEAS
jgi:hypothetical protein